MADALISPAVGGTMWAVTAGAALYSAHKLQKEQDDKKVPLMGVMGAFIFAAQMINFSIPGTGSSGHLGGGLLLAIMLGPYAGFITMASILTIQALFFADGGLLALGCNVFNTNFTTKSFENHHKVGMVNFLSLSAKPILPVISKKSSNFWMNIWR